MSTIPNSGLALVFGNFVFSDANHDIISANGANHQSMICDTLAADELSFIIKYNPGGVASNLQPFEEFTYATPILLYQDGALMFTYYLTNIAPQTILQDGTVTMKFECVSFIGLTVNMEHDGGLYVNSTAGAIIADILGATKNSGRSTSTLFWYDMSNGIHYTMDKLVANTRVDGHLPSTSQDETRSARDNLRDVLFACGVSILKNIDGSLYFTFNQPSNPISIPSNKIYSGDAFATTERVTKVSVIEHAYYQLAGTEEIMLYDTGSDIVSNLKVVFDQPCYALRGDGVTVTNSNCNKAIISGIGALYGKPYTHTQQQYIQSTGLTGPEKLLTADNGLITLLNYENVLKRVRNYYSSAREVENSWVFDNGAGTGSLVTFSDPLNRLKTGIISELEFTFSGIIKADTTIVTNWAPTEVGNNFEHCAELTGSGTWSKSAAEAQIGKSITAIRVVMISGGDGGGSGTNGSSGSGNNGGAGGTGGAAGSVGKVKTVNWGSGDTIPSTISYNCGSGGAADTVGGATSVSASGRTDSTNDSDATRPTSGYMNIINQNIYCLKGISGKNGAAGGKGATSMHNSSSSSASSTCYGSAGTGMESWNGGAKGSVSLERYYHDITVTTDSYGLNDFNFTNPYYITGGGGGGGGAAYGANGISGTNGTAYRVGTYNGYPYGVSSVRSGSGGRGAHAAAPDSNPGYGNGGNGGHGGGGGGGRGTASAVTYKYPNSSTRPYTVETKTSSVSTGSVGSGGTGSAGSSGGDGLVIIFY